MRNRIICLLFFTLLNLANPGFLTASSSEVLQGRLWLTQSNLPNAYTAFANADSGDSEAKVLKSLSALALLQRASAITNYLNSFYITSPTNIWLARDQGYRTNANAPTPYRTEPSLSTTQGVAILTNVFLPVLHEVEADLATITDTNILIPLGRAETGYPDINLDYGDILMIRTLVASGISATHLFRSQNTVAVLNEILNLEEAPGPATIEQWLQAFPNLARSANPQDLPLARAKAKEGILLYGQASDWIRTNRVSGQVRLFNLPGSFGIGLGTLYTSSLQDEEAFRTKLDEYAAGLDGPVLITGADGRSIDTFNAKPFFDGQRDLRSMTPPFRKNKVRQGTVSDPTFGGIWATNTTTRLENLLLHETYACAFDPYAFGLFVPPHISLEALPQNALSESYQPPFAFLGLGWVWTTSPARYDYLLNLFWINPTTMEFSRLFPGTIDAGWNWISEAALHGDLITLAVPNWGPQGTSYKIFHLNISNGTVGQDITIQSLPDFSIYKLLIGSEDIFALGFSSSVGYEIKKFDKSTGFVTDLGSLGGNYMWGTLTLEPTGSTIGFIDYGFNEDECLLGYSLKRKSVVDGTTLSQVFLAEEWPNLTKIAMASQYLAYGIRIVWSGTDQILSFYSLNFQNGQIAVLNANLLPAGRAYIWDSFQLFQSGQRALIQSHDGGWANIQLHEIRLSDGALLPGQSFGASNDSIYFQHLFVAPGRFLYAKRTGDLSEDISLQLAFSGTAQNGTDYSNGEPSVLILPSGNVEHPLRFYLIDDSSKEFEETVNIQGAASVASEATVQPFTLKILDNDGAGVGIFVTDNQGKEGRRNPDPFGFRFGIYDPIRYEVRRTGPITSALSVKVNRDLLLSAATPDDFEVSGFDVDGQTVRIPAGQSSAEIIVSPKFDLDYPEGTESLVFRVSADSAYALTENVSASSSILDGTPYQWWSYQMGLIISNHPPTLDIDGDGMPNLLEMALGKDPNLPDSPNSVVQGMDQEGYLTLTYKRWSGGVTAPDGSYVQHGITYRPQATSSLELPNSWSSNSIEFRSITDTGDGMELVTARDILSKNTPRRFLRLAVTLTE